MFIKQVENTIHSKKNIKSKYKLADALFGTGRNDGSFGQYLSRYHGVGILSRLGFFPAAECRHSDVSYSNCHADRDRWVIAELSVLVVNNNLFLHFHRRPNSIICRLRK